ncbi:MAG: polyprenyl synthetase family protein [Nitrospiraceae bacterium]|nr:polyprenyl synthetase family protein [Nitrospiraceae bacterium]
MFDLKSYLNDRRRLVDQFIGSYFDVSYKPETLRDSIVYSLSAGGKRIRPILCIASYEACGGNTEGIIPYASSLEFIHTYSLIHDDLPAMDNDDLRRGKPTNHKVFGEGMAILAGDGLLTEAFYLLSKNKSPKITESALLKVIEEISKASGVLGMVGGQAQDLLSENSEPDEETLLFMHNRKTAALIIASVRTGGILAGCKDDMLKKLSEYAENIGLAFQVVDDILDVEGETEVLGKPKGSDEKKQKMTYPKLYGLERSKQKAKELINNAIDALSAFDKKAEPLRAVAKYLLERKN